MARNLKYVEDEVAAIENAIEVLVGVSRTLESGLDIVDGLLKDPSEPSALGSTAYRRAQQQLRIAATAIQGAQNCLAERLDTRKTVLAGARGRDRD